MVLVDSSVWIRFLGNRAPHASHLDYLLSLNDVAGHELIYGELLIGDIGGRKLLLSNYASILYAPTVQHSDLVSFAKARRLHGRGAGWIDIHLLASALVANMQFWTADSRLAAIAEELGIAYHPTDRSN